MTGSRAATGLLIGAIVLAVASVVLALLSLDETNAGLSAIASVTGTTATALLLIWLGFKVSQKRQST